VSVYVREPWGTTRDGEPVELITLENGTLRACLTNFGATLVSLEAPDRDGERADIVLGFDSLAEYESRRNPYFGGVVGRCANRIGGARFTFDGREHVLAANEGRNHLHGGARGFDRRVWVPELEQGGGILYRRCSPDGEEGYPGCLEASARYNLGSSGACLLGLMLLAHTDAPTLCNLTQHSYFNLAGSGTILDHELQVFASRYLVVDDELLPTGEIASVEGTPYDFLSPRRIGECIGELERTPARGYDICYALDGERFHAPTARLRDPLSGRTLEIHTDQPGLQLYTGNHLDGLAGKHGVAYPRFAGLCLETQRFPDAVHHAHFPSVLLRPREPYLSTTVWMFSA
jgi:aldose 1-epimerase